MKIEDLENLCEPTVEDCVRVLGNFDPYDFDYFATKRLIELTWEVAYNEGFMYARNM